MATMLTTEIEGLDEFLRNAGSLEIDVDKIAEESGTILLNRIRDRFIDTLDPDLKIWKVSFAAKLRALEGRGQDKTLFDTGTMFRSMQDSKTGKGEVTISTDVLYAPFHNFGEGQLKRTFLAFGDDDLNFITASILEKLINP